MYTLSMPVSQLRTKMRQEFERHRYVNQLKTVDVLLFNSHQEFQVRHAMVQREAWNVTLTRRQETLNYWKQLSHVLKYFRTEEEPKARLPSNFINGFLEVCSALVLREGIRLTVIGSQRLKWIGTEEKHQRRVHNRQYHFLSYERHLLFLIS